MIYEFMATQSFNGYDKPWAPGAGENVLDPNIIIPSGDKFGLTITTDGHHYSIKGTATSSGSLNTNSIATADAVILPAGNYRSTAGTMSLYNTKGSWIRNQAQGTFAIDQSFFVKDIFWPITSGQSYDQSSFIELVEGSTAPTAWTPYENICLPEGFNIWDPYNSEFIQVYAGYVNANTRELYLRPVYEEYDGEELVGPWMSSLDPYAEDTTPTEGAFVIDFGGELTSFEITPFMLQTLLDSLGIRQHFTDGAGLLNSLMDQAQGRVRSEEELLHLSRPLKVIAIGDQLPAGLKIRPISKDVLPGLPGKFIR